MAVYCVYDSMWHRFLMLAPLPTSFFCESSRKTKMRETLEKKAQFDSYARHVRNNLFRTSNFLINTCRSMRESMESFQPSAFSIVNWYVAVASYYYYYYFPYRIHGFGHIFVLWFLLLCLLQAAAKWLKNYYFPEPTDSVQQLLINSSYSLCKHYEVWIIKLVLDLWQFWIQQWNNCNEPVADCFICKYLIG